jgi:hypothetical protein
MKEAPGRLLGNHNRRKKMNMRVVMPHDEVSVAVAAVVAHGFAAVEGTKRRQSHFAAG